MSVRRAIRYAAWYERLAAHLIDQVCTVLLGTFVASVFSGLGLLQVDRASEAPMFEQSAVLVLFLCLTGYHVLATASSWQATLGQRIMRIYVARTDGRPLTLTAAAERFFAYVLPVLPIYSSFLPQQASEMLVVWLSIFWFAPILFTAERVGMHDRMCNTRVVAGHKGI